MTRLPALLHRIGLAVLLGLGVAVAADAQPPGLDARLDRLTEGLDLRADQSAALDAIAARYAEADRADLWAAAAEVASVLSADQIDHLQQAAPSRRAERGEARREGPRMRGARDGERRPRGARGERQPRGERGPQLSDDQREALREIRDDVRTRTEALVAQLRDGAIDDDEFVARTRALREEGARRGAEVLPAEAAERMAAMQARREAAEAARERALGLTEAQKAHLQARRLDRIRRAPERPDVRPTLGEGGRVDREAFRDAMREQRGRAGAGRGDAADVLTEDQRDVVFLHRALAGGERGRRGRHRGGRMSR